MIVIYVLWILKESVPRKSSSKKGFKVVAKVKSHGPI